MFKHTFRYESKADLIYQLETLLPKLLSDAPMEAYPDVRKRYLHLSASAFTMRLRRFERNGGIFPHRKGRKGVQIRELFLTHALDVYLRKPAKPRKRERPRK
jgi:hypothetical protein